MAVNFNVDLEKNPELKAVKSDEATALKSDAAVFDDMISKSDKHYKDQINAVRKYGDEQKKIQQAQTDFAIEKIEQQKGQAKKDYIKEQSGAYTDWQKQSNPYGANAEQQASMGMTDTGYSESSQVSMYNAYQNRVATAREVFARAVLNYDNAMQDAILKNNAALAEIAFNTLSSQLKLSLEGFQYKNTLITQKAESARQIRGEYFNKWKAVLDQINVENARAEEQRQFNEQMAFEKQKWAWQTSNTGSSGGSGGSGSSSGKSSKGKSVTGSSNAEMIKKTIANAEGAKNNNMPIDMTSVLSLGYGPISADNLAEKVNNGEIIEYIENGTRKFKKPPILPFALQ